MLFFAIKIQGLVRPKYEFFKDCKQETNNENNTFLKHLIHFTLGSFQHLRKIKLILVYY